MSRVSEQHYEQLGALALREARSISEVIRMLLEDRLQEHPVTDDERAAFRRRRMEEMGIEPTSRVRGRLRSVRAIADAGPVSSLVQMRRGPVRSDRCQALKRAA